MSAKHSPVACDQTCADLLRLLKAMRQHLVFDIEGELTGEEFDDLLAEVDASIAKAEGRS